VAEVGQVVDRRTTDVHRQAAGIAKSEVADLAVN
jgi:hypothetical protein